MFQQLETCSLSLTVSALRERSDCEKHVHEPNDSSYSSEPIVPRDSLRLFVQQVRGEFAVQSWRQEGNDTEDPSKVHHPGRRPSAN